MSCPSPNSFQVLLKKDDLNKYTLENLPYNEVGYGYVSLELIKEAHEENLLKSFKFLARSIVAGWIYKNQNSKEKNIVYWFTPYIYKYNDINIEKYLPEIVGNKEEAYKYYLDRLKSAFPEFNIELISNERVYDYKIKVLLS